MDINEQVLAAFQAEHKEHIEGIRCLLSKLDRDTLQPGDERLDEAFRLAHSLKGGARVCDLRPAEKLGHQLESLFASLRQGELTWRTDVAKAVNQVLDFVEDWMVALAEDQTLPDADEAQAAISSLIADDQLEAATASAESPPSLADELCTAFCEEYAAYVDGLRRFLAAQGCAIPPSADNVAEAFRIARGLHGAAQAAELAEVEALGQETVELFARLRRNETDWDEVFRNSVSTLLDRIEAAAQAQLNSGSIEPLNVAAHSAFTVSDSSAGDGRDGDHDGVRPASEPTGSKLSASSETVRVETSSLDRLIHCSGQLMSELTRQDELAGVLGELGRDLESMRRERENLRELATGGLHQLERSPEFGPLVRYFNTIDRQLGSLTRRAHHLRRAQHRHQWQLSNRGEQIHQAARQARMVPIENMFQSFRKMVRDLARDDEKRIDFTLRGLEHRADRYVLQALKDPLMHVLRNAVVHGIESPAERAAAEKPETGVVELAFEVTGNSLRIVASDDGRGLDWDAVRNTAVQQGRLADDVTLLDTSELAKLVFEPGFTTARDVSELAGRGMGLSVLQGAVTRLQGDIRLSSDPGEGTRIELVIPLSVSNHRMVLLRAAANTYAVPISAVERLVRVARSDIETLEGSPFINYLQKPIPLVALAALLGVDDSTEQAIGESLCVAVIKSANQLLAVAVDALLAQRDAMVHDLTGPATQSPYFSGAVLLAGGEIALVLDPAAIVGKPAQKSTLPSAPRAPALAEDKPREVLVVDDSFTTRTLEKSILEAHGYRVHIAVDGVEGLSLLRSQTVDLVICDVEMPRMNGFELLKNVKADHRLKKLPFILVTSRDKIEDRENGLHLGADAYILKQKFDHQNLLDTINQVL